MQTIEPNPPLLTPVGFAVAAAAATAVAIIALVLPQASAPSTWQSAPVVAQSRDAIPFRNVNGGMYVYANLGGVPHNMLLDTGASGSQVTLPIARVLVARGQAYVADGFSLLKTADGSVHAEQTIVVYTVKIGRHTLRDVQMSVAPDGAPVLLGLSELSSIGSFTIDQAYNQIRFN
jgi:clan AA aspartic protease (TIGR02281 family)